MSINQSNLSHECYCEHMTSKTRVTIAKHDKKRDLEMIIPTFVVPRKLMQR